VVYRSVRFGAVRQSRLGYRLVRFRHHGTKG
jgi:hypothetical protein